MDGITVIDITDLAKPAYCFMPGSKTSMSGEHGVTPYTAREYFDLYFDMQEDEKSSVVDEGSTSNIDGECD